MVIQELMKTKISTNKVIAIIKKVLEESKNAEFQDISGFTSNKYEEPDLAYVNEDGDLNLVYVIVSKSEIDEKSVSYGLNEKMVCTITKEFAEWYKDKLVGSRSINIEAVNMIVEDDLYNGRLVCMPMSTGVVITR